MNKTLPVFLAAASLFVAAPVGHAQSTTLDSEQAAFLTLINNYRAQNGVGPLQVSQALQQSSQWMSGDMAAKNYFSHTDSLGRDPFSRMSAFGYSYYPEGENIAAGYSDAQNTLTQWQNACDPDSSGACTYAHRLNMLNGSFKVLGIGRVYGASSSYGWYWTTDFGAYVDQTVGSTPPPTPTPTASVPAIASFTGTPLTITAGQSVTLAWSVSGATSVSIDNGVGTVTGLTSRTVTPSATTQYTLTATNASGSKTATVTVTVNAPATSSTATSIWASTSAPLYYMNTAGAVELGVKFRSDVAGQITGIRFYKIGGDTAVHTGSLWTSTGQLLATGTFTNETSGGWQTLHFAAPVSISANTTYVASYHSTTGVTSFGFDLQNAGINNGPLHALQTGVDGYNAVYVFGAGGAFPAQGTSGYNFWVDVLFQR